MAYKQNSPFSRKTSSPLNHGTHTKPWRGSEQLRLHMEDMVKIMREVE